MADSVSPKAAAVWEGETPWPRRERARSSVDVRVFISVRELAEGKMRYSAESMGELLQGMRYSAGGDFSGQEIFWKNFRKMGERL